MKINKLLLLCIIVVIAVMLIVVKVNSKAKYAQNSLPSQAPVNTLSPQTNSEGSVSITATPKVLEKGKPTQFEVVFTTHMGSLDYDLLQVAKLVDDKGTVYKPLSWNGGKGGHHLNGTISFSSLSINAKKVTLTLSNIDTSDRIFSWNLK